MDEIISLSIMEILFISIVLLSGWIFFKAFAYFKLIPSLHKIRKKYYFLMETIFFIIAIVILGLFGYFIGYQVLLGSQLSGTFFYFIHFILFFQELVFAIGY